MAIVLGERGLYSSMYDLKGRYRFFDKLLHGGFYGYPILFQSYRALFYSLFYHVSRYYGIQCTQYGV